MTSDVLLHEARGSVLLLTLNRPHAKNAIDEPLARALEAALSDASTNPSLKVVVLAARGDVFLSGGDLKALSQLPPDARGAQAVLALGLRLACIERCPLPVVAAVSGPVFGGGCELLVMTDLVVMDETATLAFVHKKMGLAPAWGGATRLAERVGSARANELLLTARPIGAAEALAIGLAQRVAPAGAALAEALTLARELAGSPREALVTVKRSLLATRDARRGDALTAEQKVFRDAWGKAPHLEAMARFLRR